MAPERQRGFREAIRSLRFRPTRKTRSKAAAWRSSFSLNVSGRAVFRPCADADNMAIPIFEAMRPRSSSYRACPMKNHHGAQASRDRRQCRGNCQGLRETTARVPLLSFDQVSLRYGSFKAGNEVSFPVGAGDVLGDCAQNGAGKAE
ncbi:hypothetical protein JCM7686_pAMI5p056 (plasmid) [Paracoccus aminophilus JCM 7686]|uniref:Uncharacterized protein n=2 Tax=Paracoccus aminophilus TaxID=34003 RepID=S5Y0U9_PARAH|nr:hypothetical protein JCM7686_pAMI5p056 [Paracoccus aminophilus JCM 7686]